MSHLLNVPENVVQSAIGQIFQTMYFSETAYRGSARIEAAMLGTAVSFSGEVVGEFRVAVSASLAGRMAEDFLALEPGEASPEQMEAIVMEFANVACGATMSAWRPEANLHYSVPGPLSREGHVSECPYCFSVSGDSPDMGIDIRFE
jgi:hypothetical protein